MEEGVQRGVKSARLGNHLTGIDLIFNVPVMIIIKGTAKDDACFVFYCVT